jgi:hypothetical protein
MDMVRRRDERQLDTEDLRNAVYNGQRPLFQFVDGQQRMDLVQAAPYGPRTGQCTAWT